MVIRIDSAAGAISAADVPWMARAATSTQPDHASPQSSEDTPNSVVPAGNIRRRPRRSASRPPGGSGPRVGPRVVGHLTLLSGAGAEPLAAAGVDVLAGDPARVSGGQERDDV